MSSPPGDDPPLGRYLVGEFARPFGYPVLDHGEQLELSDSPRVVGHFLDRSIAEAVVSQLEGRRSLAW
jgi:hypothetical protein